MSTQFISSSGTPSSSPSRSSSPSPNPSPTHSSASPPVPFGALPLSSVPPPAFPKHKKPRSGPDLEQWTSYQPRSRQYFTLYDSDQEPISVEMVIKIDKVDQREHYSAADEAYILYRQNQFQLEVFMFGHLGSYSSNYPSETPSSASAPSFIDVNGSLVAIESLFYHVYALKQQKGEQAETSTEQESMVDLVQLGGPRNRKDFQPPGLCPIVHGRASYTRLQFRTATPNNARSHPDQPSPKQQYYRIILSLVAQINNALYFIFSKISPCFIVRGQNPGKFSQGRADESSSPLPLPLSPPLHAGRASPPPTDNPPSPPPARIKSSSPTSSPTNSIRSSSPTSILSPKSTSKMIIKSKSKPTPTPAPKPRLSTPRPTPFAPHPTPPAHHPNPPLGRNYSPPRSSTQSPTPHYIPNPNSGFGPISSHAHNPISNHGHGPIPSYPGPISSHLGPLSSHSPGPNHGPSPNPMPTHLLHQYSKILPHYAPSSSGPPPPQPNYFTPIHPPPSPHAITPPPHAQPEPRGTKRPSNLGEGEWIPSQQGHRYHPSDEQPPAQYRRHAYVLEEDYYASQYEHRPAPPPHESSAWPSQYGKQRPALGVGQEWRPPAAYGRQPGVVRPLGYDDEWPPAPHYPPPAAHYSPPAQYGRRPMYGYEEDYQLPPPPSQYGNRPPPPGDGEDWAHYNRIPHSDDWHTQLGRRGDIQPGYPPSYYGRRSESPTEQFMGGPKAEPPPMSSKKLPFSSIR